MDFETYARSKFANYGALAEAVAAILRAAIGAYPETFRLQQVQQNRRGITPHDITFPCLEVPALPQYRLRHPA